MNESYYSLGKSYTKYVYQLSAELKIKKTLTDAVWYNGKLIHDWAKNKFSDLSIPDQLCTWSRSYAGKSVDIIYDSLTPYFCIKASHPDESVPTRMWYVEAEIITKGAEARIGVKTYYSATTGIAAAEPSHSIPYFVKNIARNNGITDQGSNLDSYYEIVSEEELYHLKDLLIANRFKPVIVVSESAHIEKDSAYLLSLERLSNNLFMEATVVALPLRYQKEFRKLVGDEWAVYDGAVRTYYPNLDFEEDMYTAHPFTSPNTILAAGYGTGKVDGVYEELLVDKILRANNQQRIDWNALGHKFYNTAQRERLVSARKENANNVQELRKQLEDTKLYEKLQDEEIKRLEGEKAAFENDINILMSELDACQNDNRRLRGWLDTLRQQLSNSPNVQTKQVPIPESYDEMQSWVEKYCPGVMLHTRAIRALKSAEFQDVEKVYRVLLFLGNEYYQMRMGEISREVCDRKYSELGISVGPSIEKSRAGEQGDEYFVTYNGRRVFIDQHVRYGNAAVRDPKRVFRVYFFWDDDYKQVVICSLPGHLEIRSS